MAADSLERRLLGRTDMRVSVLGFGGAEIGYEQAEQHVADTILNSALDAGLNVIDTAACYADSETLIGNAVSGRRDDYYLFTKAGHASGLSYPDWDPKLLAASVERSLQRLRTDRLDLVQLHSGSEAVLQKGDVIAALQKIRDAGKTRYIGYSGDGAAAIYALQCGAFDTLQTSINIADQQVIDAALPIAREKKIGVIAKRPIANAAWKTGRKPENSYHHVYWQRLQELRYDFLTRPLEESVAIALRFTLTMPGVDTAIVGTRNPSRWQSNARLLQAGPLPAEQVAAIRQRWQAIARADWTGQT